MSVDILGISWDQCRSMVQYSFTSTKTRRLVRTDSPGRPPRLSHSSWTIKNRLTVFDLHSSGAVWESRWTSWAVRPNEPSGFRGRKDLLHRASALVNLSLICLMTSEDIKHQLIIWPYLYRCQRALHTTGCPPPPPPGPFHPLLPSPAAFTISSSSRPIGPADHKTTGEVGGGGGGANHCSVWHNRITHARFPPGQGVVCTRNRAAQIHVARP